MKRPQFDLKIKKVARKNRKAKKDMTRNHDNRRNYGEDPPKEMLQDYFIPTIKEVRMGSSGILSSMKDLACERIIDFIFGYSTTKV
ncbi:hypothetical protein CR513_01799, partial [Mucuna pruriens]